MRIENLCSFEKFSIGGLYQNVRIPTIKCIEKGGACVAPPSLSQCYGDSLCESTGKALPLAVVTDESELALDRVPLNGDGLHLSAQFFGHIPKLAGECEDPHIGGFGFHYKRVDLASEVVLDLSPLSKIVLHNPPRVRAVTDLTQVFIQLFVEGWRALALTCFVQEDLISAVGADREDVVVANVRLDMMPGMPLGLLAGVHALAVVVDLFRGLILSQSTLPAINVWLHEFTLSMKPHTYLFCKGF